MRKQDVWLVVFVILALGISLAVYFASRAERRNARFSKDERNAQALRANRPVDSNRLGNASVVPARPDSPNENLQQTMQTLKDIQRINKMNADNQRRQQQTPPPQAPAVKK